MSYIITGIQQLGVGVSNVTQAFDFYRKNIGFDIQVFDEAAEANLMLPYTDGKPQKRRAIFALNLNGGGGLEIWQYTSRVPQPPLFTPQLGDLGIFIAKIKSYHIAETHRVLTDKNVICSSITRHPAGYNHFYFKDSYANYFEVVESNDFFQEKNFSNGGICGAVIGVSDIDKAIKFYSEVLGFNDIIYKSTEQAFDDLNFFSNNKIYKRALLTVKTQTTAGFSKLFGKPYIELIQSFDDNKRKIFENRLWGDLGFIHLCFDVRNMSVLKQHCEKLNAPFTVDSGEKFSMGDAAGHFAYIEDPDGTLIEFVETKKVPIMKKLGWYWKFSSKQITKPVPTWMIKAFSLNRVKN